MFSTIIYFYYTIGAFDTYQTSIDDMKMHKFLGWLAEKRSENPVNGTSVVHYEFAKCIYVWAFLYKSGGS